ncbi:MOSC domain-containing protein [Lichenibacterium dinghuense]|uniref:MOSC domain-containing protein n=1 Tax=Lichenibacterium dinghuense TaxID=2895977 RepID=UPI001F018DD0|nr:MOSC N-terminal beta barrel domain-containing protein [Lichenibacterium sp. 6Y81]
MRVSDIRIYPVKGLRGHSVPGAVVHPWGLEGDRRYMVVEAASGRFLTQRQLPRMAEIAAHLGPDGLELSNPDTGRVIVMEPGPQAPSRSATVWRDIVAARDAGDEAAAFLSAALGTACRLVHMADPAADRPVDPDFSAPGDHVTFADGFPLLATSVASLEDLNGLLPHPVSMDCFRTNVAVDGAAPWAEDGWLSLRIGPVPFDGVKDCARCAVTTVDQSTGARSPENEPLLTLSLFRRKAKGRIIFGQNLIPRGPGRIAVGDEVAVA